MSELTQGILIALVPALLVSILTAYMTVRFSLRQFYSQKWWEKKAEAYSHIMEHLSYMQYHLDEWRADYICEKNLSDDTKKRFAQEYIVSKESVMRAAALGAYIVSENVANALVELLSELNKSNLNDYLGTIEQHLNAIEKCIVTIREDTKTDLHKK